MFLRPKTVLGGVFAPRGRARTEGDRFRVSGRWPFASNSGNCDWLMGGGVVETADGVTICAVYPTPVRARQENDCEPGDKWHSNTNDNDVTVTFSVQVPNGVEFNGQTVNGEMSAEGLTGDVRASTVNGSVRVSTTGLAEASTVNTCGG